MTRQVRHVRNWIITAVVVCAFLTLNVLTGPAIGPASDVLTVILVGICIGQLNLIATWAALGPGNFAVRLPWSLLLAVGMWYALVAGNRIDFPGYGRDDAIFLGLVLLFGVFVAQIPLWIAARVFRWRLVQRTDRSESLEGFVPRTQFQLWQLLLSMFLVSLALAPARLVVPEGEGFHLRVPGEVFVLLGGVAFCNLVVTVPCVWGAFLPRAMLPPLVLGWFAYCLLLTGLEFGFFVWLLGEPGPAADVFFGLWYGINVAQCATVFGTLLIFRAAGFQLRRRRSCG